MAYLVDMEREFPREKGCINRGVHFIMGQYPCGVTVHNLSGYKVSVSGRSPNLPRSKGSVGAGGPIYQGPIALPAGMWTQCTRTKASVEGRESNLSWGQGFCRKRLDNVFIYLHLKLTSKNNIARCVKFTYTTSV